MYQSNFPGSTAAFLTAGKEVSNHPHVSNTVEDAVQKLVEGLVVEMVVFHVLPRSQSKKGPTPEGRPTCLPGTAVARLRLLRTYQTADGGAAFVRHNRHSFGLKTFSRLVPGGLEAHTSTIRVAEGGNEASQLGTLEGRSYAPNRLFRPLSVLSPLSRHPDETGKWMGPERSRRTPSPHRC